MSPRLSLARSSASTALACALKFSGAAGWQSVDEQRLGIAWNVFTLNFAGA